MSAFAPRTPRRGSAGGLAAAEASMLFDRSSGGGAGEAGIWVGAAGGGAWFSNTSGRLIFALDLDGDAWPAASVGRSGSAALGLCLAAYALRMAPDSCSRVVTLLPAPGAPGVTSGSCRPSHRPSAARRCSWLPAAPPPQARPLHHARAFDETALRVDGPCPTGVSRCACGTILLLGPAGMRPSRPRLGFGEAHAGPRGCAGASDMSAGRPSHPARPDRHDRVRESSSGEAEELPRVTPTSPTRCRPRASVWSYATGIFVPGRAAAPAAPCPPRQRKPKRGPAGVDPTDSRTSTLRVLVKGPGPWPPPRRRRSRRASFGPRSPRRCGPGSGARIRAAANASRSAARRSGP